MPPRADDLEAFDAEIAAFASLLLILRQEQEALRRADADALGDIVPRKLAKLSLIRAMARSRAGTMRAAGAADTRSGLEAWLGAADSDAKGLSRSGALIDLLRTASELNASSQRLASVQARHVARASAALRRATGQDGVYGADGREQATLTPRVLAAI